MATAELTDRQDSPSLSDDSLPRGKLPKGAVAYSDTGKQDRCKQCEHFIAPHGCLLVSGKISAEGWCRLFTAAPDAGENSAWGDRDEELCSEEDFIKQVKDLMKDIQAGFRAQWERGNDQLDYWDIYNCVLGGKQVYQGQSQIYLPLVHEAVNARRTRFVNQMFPRSARNVDCITSDEKPYAIMALLEHYIRKTRLRTQVLPALVKNGDVEGHYNLYVSWRNSKRYIAYRKPATIDIEGMEIEEPDSDYDDVAEDVIEHMQPVVEVISDCDVLVMPHNSDSIGDSLSQGGSVTIIRRWTRARLEQAIDDREIDEEEGEALLEEMRDTKNDPEIPNIDKKHVDAAGIVWMEGTKILVLYETWTHLEKKGQRRLCKILYGGGSRDRILSVKRNPYWNDKCPLLSAPVDKIANCFKGLPKVRFVADLQYAANDAVNEGWDSAAYALMPIVMTDPSKNPRVGSMILNLAAIWETSPSDTKFAQFPQLWKDAFALVASAKQEIFQLLSVSPAAIAQSTGGPKTKRNQAEIANEQQVDILSTADVCTNIEDEILTPLLRWFLELDYQFRNRPLTVRQYGEMGLRLGMEEIPLIQVDRRFEFRWFGVEAARSTQMVQQQIAAVNVVKGMPPESYQGYHLNLVPVVSQLLESVFGPRVTPEIFKDIKSQLSIEPEMENSLLVDGLALPVHELDDDKRHMQVHLQALQKGDPTGAVREHMIYHRMAMMKKLQMQQQGVAAMQRPGLPGSPGGAGPGVAGTPRPGAQPGQSRGGQAPPGAIHQDQIQGTQMPRR
jgi:hypothetical protein